MPEYTIRPLEGDADYEFGVELLNVCLGEKLHITYELEQMREWLKPRDNPVGRTYLVEMHGQPIAGMGFNEMPSDDGQRRFSCNVLMLPEHQTEVLLSDLHLKLFELVREYKPDELRMGLYDFQQDYITFSESAGFKKIQRNQDSELLLSEFDFKAFADAVEHVKQSGVRLITLLDYERENPDYKAALLDLNNTIFEDVPGLESLVISLEQFDGRILQNQFILRDAWILALDGDQLVGTSYVMRYGNSDQCTTNLTGVIRSHRRRGITTAMKVTAFETLRDMGFRRILTDNEENNPMYQINVRFGFKPGPASFLYAKQLTGD